MTSAIVTGASRGIGRAIAKMLAQQTDCTVMVNYATRAEEAEKVVAEIKMAGGKALACQADVRLEKDVLRLFDQAQAVAPLRVLINNAGIIQYKKIADVSLEEYQQVFDINVTGTFLACREAARRMIDGGRIVNLSTTVTSLMLPTYGVYAASKGAVDQFTRILAKELGSRQITVNAIAPGPVATDLFLTGKSEEDVKRFSTMSALGRIATPNDISDIVKFLVSDDSRWITGQIIRTNGGMV